MTYQIQNALTAGEREIIIDHWADFEWRERIEEIIQAHGYSKDQINTRVHHVRDQLKAEGDDRWQGMYRQRGTSKLLYNPNEVIENYGPRSRTDLIEDPDADIRPCWLVVTSAHFDPREFLGGEYRVPDRRKFDPEIKKQMEVICG